MNNIDLFPEKSSVLLLAKGVARTIAVAALNESDDKQIFTAASLPKDRAALADLAANFTLPDCIAIADTQLLEFYHQPSTKKIFGNTNRIVSLVSTNACAALKANTKAGCHILTVAPENLSTIYKAALHGLAQKLGRKIRTTQVNSPFLEDALNKVLRPSIDGSIAGKQMP